MIHFDPGAKGLEIGLVGETDLMNNLSAEVGELDRVKPTITARLDDCISPRPRGEIKLHRTVGRAAAMAARHRKHLRVFGNSAEHCVAIPSDRKHRTEGGQLRKEKRPPIPKSDHRAAVRDADILAKHGGDKWVVNQTRFWSLGSVRCGMRRIQPYLRRTRSRSIAKN